MVNYLQLKKKRENRSTVTHTRNSSYIIVLTYLGANRNLNHTPTFSNTLTLTHTPTHTHTKKLPKKEKAIFSPSLPPFSFTLSSFFQKRLFVGAEAEAPGMAGLIRSGGERWESWGGLGWLPEWRLKIKEGEKTVQSVQPSAAGPALS